MPRLWIEADGSAFGAAGNGAALRGLGRGRGRSRLGRGSAVAASRTAGFAAGFAASCTALVAVAEQALRATRRPGGDTACGTSAHRPSRKPARKPARKPSRKRPGSKRRRPSRTRACGTSSSCRPSRKPVASRLASLRASLFAAGRFRAAALGGFASAGRRRRSPWPRTGPSCPRTGRGPGCGGTSCTSPQPQACLASRLTGLRASLFAGRFGHRPSDRPFRSRRPWRKHCTRRSHRRSARACDPGVQSRTPGCTGLRSPGALQKSSCFSLSNNSFTVNWGWGRWVATRSSYGVLRQGRRAIPWLDSHPIRLPDAPSRRATMARAIR